MLMKFKAPLLISLFILIGYIGFAQQFIVSGTVTDKKTLKPIVGAIVTLVGSDGSVAAVKTDTGGHYEFVSKQIKPNISYLLSADAREENYLASPKKISISPQMFLDTKTFIADFELQKGQTEERWFPRVVFNKNSYTLSDSDKNEISYLIKLMNDNPKIVVQLDGHASPDEIRFFWHAKHLSKARADACRTYMISQRIDPERIKTKGWSNKTTLPGCSKSDINSMARKSEKDSAEADDCRVEFRVLRLDYEPKK